MAEMDALAVASSRPTLLAPATSSLLPSSRLPLMSFRPVVPRSR